jgi:hypothetical protein
MNLNFNQFLTWGKIRHRVPQSSILGPLLFLIYINDLPKIINDKTVPILFADDTSLLVKSSKYDELCVKTNNVFRSINEWFIVNQLSINFNKSHYIQFTTRNNNSKTEIKITYVHLYQILNFLEYSLMIKWAGNTTSNTLFQN